MLKLGVLHPQLARVLADQRHMDTLIIGDAGLPVPKGVERIDLGWRAGDPRYVDVLEELLKYFVVEKAILADEMKEVSPHIHEKTLALLPEGVEVEYIAHSEFKEQSKEARAIILTGEFTPYANIILVSGCAF